MNKLFNLFCLVIIVFQTQVRAEDLTADVFVGGVLHVTQNPSYNRDEGSPLNPSEINQKGSAIYNLLVLGKQNANGKIIENGPECNYFIVYEKSVTAKIRSAPLVGIVPLVNNSERKANHAGYSVYGEDQYLNKNYFGIEIDGVWDQVPALSQLRTLRKLLISLRVGHMPDPDKVDYKIGEYENSEKTYLERNRSEEINRQIQQFNVPEGGIEEEGIIGHYACAVNQATLTLGRKMCGKELTTPLTRLLLGLNILKDHPNLDRKKERV